MVFGAITGLLASVGYSIGNRLYVSHKIRSYKPPIDTTRKTYNANDANKLIALYYANWCNDGASLYPQKLLPLLASDENLRRLWVSYAIELILDGVDPYNGMKTQRYADQAWIEYDFVAAFYPDDWAKYEKFIRCNVTDDREVDV